MNLDRDLLESPFSLVGDPERDFESLLDCAELEIKYLNFSLVLFYNYCIHTVTATEVPINYHCECELLV